MSKLVAPVPREPIALEAVWELFPTIRQSLLSSFDDCALSTYFELAHGQGWSTHPQARGTLMHRFYAECLRTMRQLKQDSIPVTAALEILYETLLQRDVPVEELVRVPLREVRDMRMEAVKFAADNTFDVHRIVDLEKRLEATVTYPHPETGEPVERTLTGQLDALIAEPPDGAIVIDWKSSWQPPQSIRVEDDGADPDDAKRLSYHGYFQQRFYAWLVMKNFSNVHRVTLREFYVRRTEARPATLTRDRLHHVEQEMEMLALHFDRAFSYGAPPKPYRPHTIGPWEPQPGKHCQFCLKPGACPIEDEAKGEGAVTTRARAEKYAGEYVQARKVYEHRRDALKPYVDVHGPVAVKNAKGRQQIGWVDNSTGSGRRFVIHETPESDRGPRGVDKQLVDAMRQSTQRARAAKAKRPRRRKNAA